MKYILLIVIIFIVFAIYCMLRLSSTISREEEKSRFISYINKDK